MMQAPLFAPVSCAPSLRPYQADVLERASKCSETHQSILIVMPTGTGKTRVAVEACVRHVARGGLPMFVAPRRELVRQASDALAAAGLTVGFDVLVCTIQELTMPGAVIPPATMIVLDEARHYVAEEWSKLRRALPDALILGLDATPERGDGLGLGSMFGVLLEAITVQDAVEQEYLVPCEVIRPERSLGLDLAQDPFNAWMRHATELSTVIFVRSVEDAQKLAARINETSGEAEAVWGDMPTADRDRALARFAAGDLGVLVNVQLLTEGWDAPITSCVILACNVATVGGYLQRVGRGMRLYPGKRRMLLIDLPGVSHVHGDPDEPRTWHLEGRAARRASDGIAVRFCPVCGAQVEEKTCAQCGYGGDMKKRKPRVLGLPIDRFKRERALPEEQQIKALAGYMRAARAKRYRLGWALKCWEHKFGRKVTTELKRAATKLAG